MGAKGTGLLISRKHKPKAGLVGCLRICGMQKTETRISCLVPWVGTQEIYVDWINASGHVCWRQEQIGTNGVPTATYAMLNVGQDGSSQGNTNC